MNKDIKEYKRIFEQEKSNASQHYQNAKYKGNTARADKHWKSIQAFDFAIKKVENEILKIEFNLPVIGSALCPTCMQPISQSYLKCKNEIHRIYAERHFL